MSEPDVLPPPLVWWYLSISETIKGFYGVAFVEASTEAMATREACIRGIIPMRKRSSVPAARTFEIVSIPLVGEREKVVPDERWRNRLLDENTIQFLWPDAQRFSAGEIATDPITNVYVRRLDNDYEF